MKIAVIGCGISGMVSAYLLSEDHEVHVFEANDYPGGHTCTVDVEVGGETYAVDTGFIVFNEKTYPNFIRLMRRLGVAWQTSGMSFSVQCERTGFYFSPSTLDSLFAQRRNILRPSFYRMLLDALRFRVALKKLLERRDDTQTLQDYLQTHRYSRYFIDHFIVPMGASIWSADPSGFRDFPARYFAAFFHNHGLLNIRRQPRWLVIRGGSRQYIAPLTRRYRDRIRLNCPVDRIRRRPSDVEVVPRHGEAEFFDEVVLAVHSDEALKLLDDPSDAERAVLAPIVYQPNDTVLHTDDALLPPRRAAWASWNYHIPKQAKSRVALTYDMNILQSLAAPLELCVSLNMTERIRPHRVIRRVTYEHPVYTPPSLAARRRHAQINGRNHTWFCGAYWGYGFHEDGVNSALAVTRHFGKGLE
jgi:predicted NAD/FAD-binding protein